MQKPWLDRVAAELARRRVPRGVRARLLAELRDHLDDITHEGLDMDVESKLDARLGEPGEVAAVAVEHYRRAGWVRRHPVMVFGLLPLPAAVLAVVGYVLAFILVGVVFEAVVGDWPQQSTRAFAVALMTALPYLPFVLAAALLGRLAGRHHVSRAWLWVAVGQVAVCAGSLVPGLVLSDVPGESMCYVGLTAPGVTEFDGVFCPLTWAQLPQLLAPLAAAWLVARRAGRRALAA